MRKMTCGEKRLRINFSRNNGDFKAGFSLVETLLCLGILGILIMMLFPLFGMQAKAPGITGYFVDYSKVGVCREIDPKTNKCNEDKGYKIFSSYGSNLSYNKADKKACSMEDEHNGNCMPCRAVKDVSDLLKIQNGVEGYEPDGCYILMDDINFEKTMVRNAKGRRERVYVSELDCKNKHTCQKVYNDDGSADEDTLYDYTWKGIGTKDAPFSGVFLGNGKIIYNLGSDEKQATAGLFNVVKSSAVIQDFGIHNSRIQTDGKVKVDAVGFLAGEVVKDGSSEFSVRNVYLNNSKITVAKDGMQGNQNTGGLIGKIGQGVGEASIALSYSDSDQKAAGGLVGYSDSKVKLERCHVTGDTTADAPAVGGFIGRTKGAEINLSYNYNGDVTKVGEGNGASVGGFVGDCAGSLRECTVRKSWVNAEVAEENATRSNPSVGGMIGNADSKLTVTDSYTTGSVKSEGNYAPHVGGIVGLANDIELNRVYSNATVDKNHSSGEACGIAGVLWYSETASLNNTFYDETRAACAITANSMNPVSEEELSKIKTMEYTSDAYEAYDWGQFLMAGFGDKVTLDNGYPGHVWKNSGTRPILSENPEALDKPGAGDFCRQECSESGFSSFLSNSFQQIPENCKPAKIGANGRLIIEVDSDVVDTSEACVIINNEDQLIAWRNTVSDETYMRSIMGGPLHINAVIGNKQNKCSIKLKKNWVPPTFGSITGPGSYFYGNGNRICNLTIDGGYKQGLFGTTAGGVGQLKIYDLGLENVSINGSGTLGAFVGEGAVRIENSYATGSVSGGDASSYIGGLVGKAERTSSGYGVKIKDSFAKVDVKGLKYIGGLVGSVVDSAAGYIVYDPFTGEFRYSYSNGVLLPSRTTEYETIYSFVSSSDSGFYNVYAEGKIKGDDVVMPTGVVMQESSYIGGLIGQGSGLNVSKAHFSGEVEGTNNIGGLAGTLTNSAIYNSYSKAAVVSGRSKAGGLAAQFGGDRSRSFILKSYSLGSVEGRAYSCSQYSSSPQSWVGGLVGVLSGALIEHSYSKANVSAGCSIGGLVGVVSNGMIKNSYSAGNTVSSSLGDYCNTTDEMWCIGIGGLVGVTEAGTPSYITESFSSSEVTGGNNAGGLVGHLCSARSIVNKSYATGNVKGRTNVGGLVGRNFGYITTSYATGDVSKNPEGPCPVIGQNYGGLVGLNLNYAGTDHNWVAPYTLHASDVITNFYSISNSYATGNVTEDGRSTSKLIAHDGEGVSGTTDIPLACHQAGGCVKDLMYPEDPLYAPGACPEDADYCNYCGTDHSRCYDRLTWLGRVGFAGRNDNEIWPDKTESWLKGKKWSDINKWFEGYAWDSGDFDFNPAESLYPTLKKWNTTIWDYSGEYPTLKSNPEVSTEE